MTNPFQTIRRVLLGALMIAAAVALGLQQVALRDTQQDLIRATTEVAGLQALADHRGAALRAADTATLQLSQAKARIYTETKEVIRELPILVPAGACELPPGFRLLHDTTAGVPPTPEAPSSPDGAPVDAQAVALTVAENYAACRSNTEQLLGLQQWVRGVTE